MAVISARNVLLFRQLQSQHEIDLQIFLSIDLILVIDLIC
jgi:hypothetical protein